MFFPPHDRVFQIEVTTQCNLKCEGCIRTVGVNAKDWKNLYIDIDVFRQAIANTRPAQAIILQGIGEPTLHPQLPELISIAKESGKFHTIAFYTNALARSIEYYDDLQKRGHNLVTVSVDSLNQEIADICRAGTDVKKLLQRLCELYYTYSPNLNISLVLSRKNLFDSFQTLETLNKIASAGSEYITVFVQKMMPTSDKTTRDFILTPEETEIFRAKMPEMKPQYKKLRIGLVGDLNIDEAPPVPAMPMQGPSATTTIPPSQPTKAATPVLCDKPYFDRFVAVDGFMTPCCVMTHKAEWKETRLDQPIETLLQSHPNLTQWYKNYEAKGHPACAGCSLMSPLKISPSA